MDTRASDVTVTSQRRYGLTLSVLIGLLLWGVPARAQSQAQADITTTACAAGNQTATGCVVLPVTGMGTAAVQITGTWVGTITFQGSIRGGTFNNIACSPTAADSTAAETTTANGLFSCPVSGLTQLRVGFTSFTSGTARVDLQAAVGGGGNSGSATLTGDVTVGDVGVTSFPDNEPFNLAQIAGTGTAVGAGNTDAGTQRVVIATNQAAVPIADGGGSITVDGAVAALVSNSGTFATQVDGAALTSLQLLDNAISGAGFNITQLAGATTPMTTTQADNLALTLDGLNVASFNYVYDGTNLDLMRGSATDGVLVNLGANNDITGTVTANLGATDNGVLDNIDTNTDALLASSAPVNAGAATATSAFAVAGQYNLTPPTFTDGQQGSLQLNSAGALIVTGGGGGTEYVVNAAAPANPTGSATVAERDDALSALTEVEGDWTNLRSDANGALWVILSGTSAVSGTVTANAGTNLNTSALALESGGNLATLAGMFGTAGTADTQVVTVQGIASMTPLLATVTATNLDVQSGGVDLATQTSMAAAAASLDTLDSVAFLTTTAYAAAFGTAGSADSQVMTVQGVASMTPLLTTTTLAAGSANIGDVDIASGTITTVTSLSQLGGVALPVEDAAETAAGVGIYSMSVRRDTAASSAGTTGDNATINTDSIGRLWVTGSAVEDVAETAAGILNMAGTVRRDTAASSAGTTGDNATLNTDAVGALWVNPFSQTPAAATYLPIRISDGSSFLTPGTDYTHDSALTTSTTAGPMLMGRGKDAAPTNVSTDDDAVLAWFLRNGSQVTNLAAGSTLITATGTSLNINCTAGCSGGTQYTHDAALTIGSSLTTLAGARASATAPTNVSTDNDAVALWALQSGALAVQPTFGGTLASAGNGTAATAQRVTLASDSTGIVALTTSTASIGKLAANSGVDIGDVDVTSAVITGGGVANDASAAAVNPILIGAYASQAAPSDVSGDNDSVRLWALRNGSQVVNLAAGGTLITSTGANLNVQCANCSGSGASGVDDAAFVIATDSVAPAGFLLDDTSPDSVNEGDVGLARMSANRNQYVTIRDGANNERGLNIDASGQIAVTLAASQTLATVSTVTSLTQFNGNTIDLGTGSIGAGTLRTVEANNSPVSSVLGATSDAAATAGSSGSISAKARLMTSQLDTIATSLALVDNTTNATEDAAETAGGVGIYAMTVRRDTPASSAGTSGDNATANTDGNGYLWTRTADPCSALPKLYVAINQATGTQLFTGTASNRTYICHVNLVTATAQNIALVSGTGTVCGTSTGPLMGGTTAATGWNFAANGGIAAGGGTGAIAKSDTDADNICLLQSSTGQISGVISYVVAPN